MSVPEPVLNLDGLLVETIGVVPAPGPEELTQGHGLTELGASGDCEGDCDCAGSCEAIA